MMGVIVKEEADRRPRVFHLHQDDSLPVYKNLLKKAFKRDVSVVFYVFNASLSIPAFFFCTWFYVPFVGVRLWYKQPSQMTGQKLAIINPLFSLFINTVSYVHC